MTTMTMEDVAAKLLADNFILTALELHTELMETGRHVKCLQDYFSNPVNFESTMQGGRDDGIHYDHGVNGASSGVDDQLAVCEFELRQANDTIKSLRAQLTNASESTSVEPTQVVDHTDGHQTETNNLPIKQHEQRALNYLVHEYLLQNDYRMSSITLCEEVTTQDVQDWDDVGLNTARPPELVTVFRRFVNAADDYLQTTSTGTNTDNVTFIEEHPDPPEEDDDDLADLMNVDSTELINRLNEENNRLINDGQVIEKKVVKLEKQVAALQEQLSKRPTPAPSSKAHTPPRTLPILTPTPKPLEGTPTRMINTRLLTHLLTEPSTSALNGETEENVVMEQLAMDLKDEKTLVEMLKTSLPRILPNVLVNKRHEMIGILVTVAFTCEDEQTDDILSHLFSLLAKPTAAQRYYIASGCAAFARNSNAGEIEARLLPLCWEQMSHKHWERRALVADTCMLLAPVIPSHLVSSLILSMISQMFTEEKSSDVKLALVYALSVCVTVMADESKIKQVRPIVFNACIDSSQRVKDAAISNLLPSFCTWAMTSTDFTQTVLDPLMLATIECPSRHVPLLGVMDDHVFHALMRHFDEGDQTISEGDVPENEILGTIYDEVEYQRLHRNYSAKVSAEWWARKGIDLYLHEKCSAHLVENCLAVPIEDTKTMNALVLMLHRWNNKLSSQYFFKAFAGKFKSSVDEKEISETVNTALIPVYAAGVLCGEKLDAKITNLYTSPDSSVDPCCHAIISLIISPSSEIGLKSRDSLVELICSLVTHDETVVRVRVAKCIQTAVIAGATMVQAKTRLLPALITLANDAASDQVRAATVPVLLAIVEHWADDERLTEKVCLTIATLFVDESTLVRQSLLVSIASRAPTLSSNVREKVVLPELTQLANNDTGGVPLFDALSALSCCPLSDSAVKNHLAPSLRRLVEQLDGQHARIAQSILNDVENKITKAPVVGTSSPFSTTKLTPNINYSALKTSLRQTAANISTNLYHQNASDKPNDK